MSKIFTKKSLFKTLCLVFLSLGLLNFVPSTKADEALDNCKANPALCDRAIVPPPYEVFDGDAGSDVPYDDEITLEPDPNTAPATVIKVASKIIDVIFKVAGLIGMVGAIVAGILMIIGRGNDEYLSAAKKIVTYSFIGMIIIATAYMFILGISQINLG